MVLNKWEDQEVFTFAQASVVHVDVSHDMRARIVIYLIYENESR